MQTQDDARIITGLLNAYGRGIDRGDFSAVARLFEHGSWNSREGSEAAEAYLARNIVLYDDGTPRTVHTYTNLSLAIEGDSAEATSRGVVFFQPYEGTEPRPIVCLDYHDWFWKPDGEWRFRHRLVTTRFSNASGHLRVASPAPSGAPESPSPLDEVAHRDPAEAIRRLLARYARALDEGDTDAVITLFECGLWNGLDTTALRESAHQPRQSRTAHAISNLEMSVGRDEARCTSIATVFEMPSDESQIRVVRIDKYEDRFERGDQAWYWLEHRAVPLLPREFGTISPAKLFPSVHPFQRD